MIFSGQAASADRITVTADNGPKEHFKGLYVAAYKHPSDFDPLLRIPLHPGATSSQNVPHLLPHSANYEL
jgi:hypothetical protein